MPIVTLLTHGLGDVAMAIPLLRSIARVSDRHTVVVRTDAAADLVRLADVRGIADLLVCDATNRRAAVRLLGAIRRLKAKALLMPHSSGRPASLVFAAAAATPLRVGPSSRLARMAFTHLIGQQKGEHKVEYYLRFGRPLGVTGDPGDGRVTVGALTPTAATDARVIFAPGSGIVEAHKRWPMHRFIELAVLLKEAAPSCDAVFVGTESERTFIVKALTSAGTISARVVVVNRVEETLQTLAGAACVVSGCSGTGHLAAAIRIPVVGLYGPTNPLYTAPYGTSLQIVRSDMPCAPCYRRGFIRGCGDPVCMESIPAAAVLPHVLACLSPAPLPAGRLGGAVAGA